MSYGRYYEDFTVGQEFRHWPGRTITEADCTWFALLTMNQHPLHSDAHYAETHTQHKQRVVLGPLVFSVVIGMTVADISGRAIANLEVNALRHEKPTFIGDTLYAQSRVLGLRESRAGRSRDRDGGDARHQPARRPGVLVFSRSAGASEESSRPSARAASPTEHDPTTARGRADSRGVAVRRGPLRHPGAGRPRCRDHQDRGSGRGRRQRALCPALRGEADSPYFQSFNRGKRSLTLNLRHPDGQAVLHDLVKVSDAVFNNARGDLPGKLGLTYESLKAVNPRIVCCALTGFGTTGPRAPSRPSTI